MEWEGNTFYSLVGNNWTTHQYSDNNGMSETGTVPSPTFLWEIHEQ
jgi:hypothetical protein